MWWLIGGAALLLTGRAWSAKRERDEKVRLLRADIETIDRWLIGLRALVVALGDTAGAESHAGDLFERLVTAQFRAVEIGGAPAANAIVCPRFRTFQALARDAKERLGVTLPGSASTDFCTGA